MPKVFNTTAVCIPEEHYMVDISGRLEEIKSLVDTGKYFTINRARQYGKTTTLRALYRYLQKEYYVVLLDFQTFDNDKFENGNVFSAAFINSFLRSLKRNTLSPELEDAIKNILHSTDYTDKYFSLKELFEQLSDLCAAAEKKIVLMIDEVDSASNNQVFLDFLAQLRAQYIERDIQPTFRAVILAGVYDVKNLRRKIRPDEVHKYNSPWNIAADFKVDMSFSREEIAGMLDEYEKDYHTGMDVELLAGLIREYTSGYPFLVSRICQLLDEEIRHAAEIACVDESILHFTDGYDTIVGERGVTLSGGQKQRVAIARMLMKQAPVLVFDDSLSAVDTETDNKIRKELKKEMEKATVIMISHRITSLMQADCIIVMDKGEIQQMGTHDQLIQQEGPYKDIYEIQMNSDIRLMEGGAVCE